MVSPRVCVLGMFNYYGVSSPTLLRACRQSMSSEALKQAQAEELTLLVAESKTGYFGVHLTNAGKRKPYQALVKRGGKTVSLGMFATAEEAALCVARSPEGQAAALQPAPPPPAPPATARRTAPPPRLWRSGLGSHARHRGSPLRDRA